MSSKKANHRIRSKKANPMIRSKSKPNHRIRSKKVEMMADAIIADSKAMVTKGILKSMAITSKDEAIIELARANHMISIQIKTELAKAFSATLRAAKMNQNEQGTASVRNLYVGEWYNALCRLAKLLENS